MCLQVRTLSSAQGPSLSYFTPFLSAMQIIAVPDSVVHSDADKLRSSMVQSFAESVHSDTEDGRGPECDDSDSHSLDGGPPVPGRQASDCSALDTFMLHSEVCSTQRDDSMMQYAHAAWYSMHMERSAVSDPAELPGVARDPLAFKSGDHCPQHLVANWSATGPVWERPPLFLHVDELCSQPDGTVPGVPVPAALRSMPLQNIHPSSWFAILWHPLYRIPDDKLKARFITYHSFSAVPPSGGGGGSAVCRLTGLLVDVGDSSAVWTDWSCGGPDGGVVRWQNPMERELECMRGAADELSRSVLYVLAPDGSMLPAPVDHSDYQFVCNLQS